MGVYIKGMEMPTRCGRCDMCVKEVDGDIDYHYECCITAARIDNLGEKMEDCPLIPVPPHGDLIERDKLLNGDGVYLVSFQKSAIDTMKIIKAPTIIPEEEAASDG